MLGCSSEAASRASALEARDRIRVLGVLGRDDLQRHRAVELDVGGLVDDAHPAAVEHALDPVAREQGPGSSLVRRSLTSSIGHALRSHECDCEVHDLH